MRSALTAQAVALHIVRLSANVSVPYAHIGEPARGSPCRRRKILRRRFFPNASVPFPPAPFTGGERKRLFGVILFCLFRVPCFFSSRQAKISTYCGGEFPAVSAAYRGRFSSRQVARAGLHPEEVFRFVSLFCTLLAICSPDGEMRQRTAASRTQQRLSHNTQATNGSGYNTSRAAARTGSGASPRLTQPRSRYSDGFSAFSSFLEASAASVPL